MSGQAPTICDVCTNPMRTLAEYEHAVCSSCRPAFNAGYHRAMAEVRAALDEFQPYHTRRIGSALLAIGRIAKLAEAERATDPLTDRDDS